MKKLLLLCMSCLSSVAMAQISTSVSPTVACPNSTQDVTVSVTNNSAYSISGMMVTVRLNVKSNTSSILGSYNGNPGTINSGETRQFIIEDVAFEGAMTCTIDGSIETMTMGPPMMPGGAPMPMIATYPISAQNYTVEYPEDLTILQTGAVLSVTTAVPTDLTVRYYLDADYATTIDESTTGSYTPTADGSYTAKLYDASYSCFSENASNAIVIAATSVTTAFGYSVSVFPNPVTSFVTVETGTAASLSFELSDLNGKQLQSGSIESKGIISMENLKAGVYQLMLKNGKDQIASYKLVK